MELATVPPEPIAGQTPNYGLSSPRPKVLKSTLARGVTCLLPATILSTWRTLIRSSRMEATQIQFNLTFPRPRPYRVWVQFQRMGVVNTVHFDVPVKELGL